MAGYLSKNRCLIALVLVFAAGSTITACSDDTETNPVATPKSDASTDAVSETDEDSSADAGDSSADSSTTDSSTTDSSTPDAAADAADASDAASADYTVWIGSGLGTSCALSKAGKVKCWGDNVEAEMLLAPVPGSKCFQFGEDPPTVDCDPRVPTDLVLPYPVVELSVGYLSMCAIFDNSGTKKLGCWGNNNRNELGSAPAGVNQTIVWIDLPAQPKHLAAGRNFKLAWLEDGTVWGWGDNRYGQYGAIDLEENAKPSKVFPFRAAADPDAGPEAGAPDATVDAGTLLSISTAVRSTFILTSDGLYGAGDNASSALMLPNAVDEYHSFIKLPVPAGTAIASLHTGCARAYGQCYITTDGKAFCWGDNDTGQISSTLPDVQETPVQIAIPAGKKVSSLSEGAGQACAAIDDGTVYCWGQNRRGECGKAASQDPIDPYLIPGLSKVSMLASGIWYYTCALTTEHKTFCWGDGSFGQLGTISPADGGTESATPVEIPIKW